MTTVSQSQFSQQMVQQIRLLNPNFSAEVGTPERILIDTVAQSLSDTQIDLVGLRNALNIDSKFGSNLDNFTNLFGFARQEKVSASGFVVFSRNTPSEMAITVPQGVVLQSTHTNDGRLLQYTTASSVVLPAGSLETQPVLIKALNPGISGNAGANTITIMVGEKPFGITGVTNPSPITGGIDEEDDASFKVRFKNTVFRNLAGTEDQFLALAVSTAYTTKANVVGPVSQYQEYVQIPQLDDTKSDEFGGEELGEVFPGTPRQIVTTGSVTGTKLTIPSTTGLSGEFDVFIFNTQGPTGVLVYTAETKGKVASPTEITLPSEPPGSPSTNVRCLIGPNLTTTASEWTTTLSTIPYAKNIWSSRPTFVTNGLNGLPNVFFREGVDYTFNFPPRFQGDALRGWLDGTGFNPVTDAIAKTQPNMTFTNVYTGTNVNIQAIIPSQVVLMEFSYTSSSSRNDLERNITNAVDIFIDGANEQPSTVVFAVPQVTSSMVFNTNPNSMYYYENYRREGEPTKRPLLGNFLTPLLQQPITSLPKEIRATDKEGNINNYYLGTHYWLVHDVSEYQGTIRARDGIEWSHTIAGDAAGLGPQPEPLTLPPAPDDPSLADPFSYSTGIPPGVVFEVLSVGAPSDIPVEVSEYFFDKNIQDLQATLEGARQVTTDVLAHKAHTRYFKLDIAVIYDPSQTPSDVNNHIHDLLSSYFNNRYFGASINLSDLLQQIHSVGGVQNVRWSNDIPKSVSEIRVFETDINGNSLLNASVDRLRPGSGSAKEEQELYIMGNPTGGGFTLTYRIESVNHECPIEISKLIGKSAAAKASYIKTQIENTGVAVTVETVTRPTIGVNQSIESYRITFNVNHTRPLPRVTNGIKGAKGITKHLKGGEYVYDTDFFLKDNELPALPTGMQVGDTVPGLIIRPRAQGTWQRSV